MSDFILIWLAAGLSGLLIIWGMNVPARHRTPVTFGLMALIFVFAVLAQTYQQAVEEGERNFPPRALMEIEGSSLREAVSNLAMRPGALLDDPSSYILQIITSSFTHHGWLPLILNLWFIGVFGHALEGLIGSLRFALIAACSLLLPAILDGLIPVFQIAEFTGGASGLVYGILAAVLIRMPRAKVHVAFNTSPEFWAAILLLLGPMTFIAMHANVLLVQIVIIIGFAAAFYTVQPVFSSSSLSVLAAIIYKLIIDVALLWPLTNAVIGNSPWRIMGGAAVGALAALACCGVRGFNEMWGEQSILKAPRTRSRSRSAKQVRKAAQYDEESARNFLGQRVFIADAAAVVDFYSNVVMEKFPAMVLPPQEQLSLARLLHSKFREREALHAYEAYLRTYTVDYERWTVWLTAAELLRKVDPDRTEDARHYLTTFMENTAIMMRDRMEAERLLKELPPEEKKKEKKAKPDSEPKTATPGSEYTGLKNLPATKRRVSSSSSDISADTVMMPRLTPTCFAVVDGVPQDEIRRSRPSQQTDTSSGDSLPSFWVRHPMRTRPDTSKENVLPLKIKHTWDHAAQPSGAYGVDKPGTAPRPRAGSRMAQVEAIKSSTYAARDSTKRIRAIGGENQPSRIPTNYGGVTDQAPDAPRPKLRLRREKEKEEGSGAGGGT